MCMLRLNLMQKEMIDGIADCTDEMVAICLIMIEFFKKP